MRLLRQYLALHDDRIYGTYSPRALSFKVIHTTKYTSFKIRGIKFSISNCGAVTYDIHNRDMKSYRGMGYFNCTGVFACRKKRFASCIASFPVADYGACVVGCTLYANFDGVCCKYHLCDDTITFKKPFLKFTHADVDCCKADRWHILYAYEAELVTTMRAKYKSNQYRIFAMRHGEVCVLPKD